MNILRKNNSFELLGLALAEQDARKRYGMLNAAAEAFSHGETDIERNFAAVCYELNGEPHAAFNCMTGYAVEEDTPETFFARSCLALWRCLKSKNSPEAAKEMLQKTVANLMREKNYRELGCLLKIQKMLFEKASIPPEDFFSVMELPSIVVLKIFTPAIPYDYSNESFGLCEQEAEKLKDKTAVVISSCTNILEQKMLEILIKHGTKAICAPLVPIRKLRDAYRSQIGDSIATTMRSCELLEPVADYSPDEKDVWALVEAYGARHLLGLGMLYKEEMELPIRYVWADFTNTHATNELKTICEDNDIDAIRIGGQNA